MYIAMFAWAICDIAKLPMPSDKPQVSPVLESLRCVHYHYNIIQTNDVIFIIINNHYAAT